MASATEIADFLDRLRKLMPPPRGHDLVDYFEPLSPFTAADLRLLADKLGRAEFDDINHAFYPNPALMAQLMRRVIAERDRESAVERFSRHAAEAREHREAFNRIVAERQPGWRERAAVRLASFKTATDAAKADAEAKERADVRARYGMTNETLASIPDAKLDNWEKAQ